MPTNEPNYEIFSRWFSYVYWKTAEAKQFCAPHPKIRRSKLLFSFISLRSFPPKFQRFENQAKILIFLIIRGSNTDNKLHPAVESIQVSGYNRALQSTKPVCGWTKSNKLHCFRGFLLLVRVDFLPRQLSVPELPSDAVLDTVYPLAQIRLSSPSTLSVAVTRIPCNFKHYHAITSRKSMAAGAVLNSKL